MYVPRCRPCWAAQNPQHLWVRRCFLAGAIVAPLFGPLAAAIGASVLLLWVGIRWVKKPSFEDGSLVFFGGLLFIWGVLLIWTTIAHGIPEYSPFRDVPWQILGGGIVCAAAARVFAWLNPPRLDVVMKDHQEYQNWVKKGYHIVKS